MFRVFKNPGFISYLFPYRIWSFSNESKTVYLTFDDGPQPRITSWVLDFLKTEKIQATFFCLGENVSLYPDLFERIRKEGHAVGNHTMSHESYSGSKVNSYLQSIKSAKDLIPSELFRPPFGKLNRKLAKLISREFKIIMWSWMAYDFDKRVGIDKIIEKSKRIKSGDILVFHDNLKSEERLKIILPKIVSSLKESGFQFKIIPD